MLLGKSEVSLSPGGVSCGGTSSGGMSSGGAGSVGRSGSITGSSGTITSSQLSLSFSFELPELSESEEGVSGSVCPGVVGSASSSPPKRHAAKENMTHSIRHKVMPVKTMRLKFFLALAGGG